MCGIVGGFGLKLDSSWINNETKHLRRRGPDYHAVEHFGEKLIMGSARLAMTDPHPRSNQPFTDNDRKIAISFNGEIYNYVEIGSFLATKNIKLRTKSDTEVLLHAQHYFGNSVHEYIHGMYSYAYYDVNLAELTLARDGLGKKPLYFWNNQESIYWSSSLESIKRLEKKVINENSIKEYLSLGYTIDPETIWNSIFTVKPGTNLVIKFINNKISIVENMNAKYLIPKNRNSLSLRENINLAVKDRMIGHGSVAISMSGGLDSSIIAMAAAKNNPNTTAYSISWPDSDKERYNTDSKAAKLISANAGINFSEVEMPVASKIENSIDTFVSAMEEPNSNPSGVSMVPLYNNIKNDGHRLVLTGDGADEILGGYPRYLSALRIKNILRINTRMVDRIITSKRTSRNHLLINLLISQLATKNTLNWMHWHWNFTPQELSELYKPAVNQFKTIDLLRGKVDSSKLDKTENIVEHLMLHDREIWLTNESNRKLDRISMWNSIEARSPFEDENVIDCALTIMKNNNYRILNKKLLREEYPELNNFGVRNDKAGFISPVGHWLRSNPELVRKSISHLKIVGNFNASYLNKLSDAPMRGIYREIMQLWSLVILSKWIIKSNYE